MSDLIARLRDAANTLEVVPMPACATVCDEAAATLVEAIRRQDEMAREITGLRNSYWTERKAHLAAGEALEPFMALAREMMEPRPDNEWLKDCRDNLIIFSFAGFGVTIADLRKLAALSAPAEESEEVADFVDEDLQCLEGLEEESSEQVELLKELRHRAEVAEAAAAAMAEQRDEAWEAVARAQLTSARLDTRAQALRTALETVHRSARGPGDGSRRFDDCISALDHIDDICRSALPTPPKA